MSNDKIAELERELRAAQEILFFVLDEVGEPVRFNLEEAKSRLGEDRIIDLTLDEEAGEWVAQVVSLGNAE